MSYILRYRLLFFIIWLLPMIGNSQDPNTPVPYTLADRDRMIKLEMEVSSLRNEMNLKFESQQKQFEYLQRQIDDFKSTFFWITGVIISLILMLFGYIVWDRNTVLRPFQQELKLTVSNFDKLKNAIIDVVRDNPKIKEALNRQGLE